MKSNSESMEHKWLTLTAVCFGGFMAAMDTSIVNVILPELVKVLNTDFAWVQWVVMGYLFTVTVLILCFGKIGDIVGKKKVYLTGFCLFLAGSLLCAMASTVQWLIAFRIFQGVGGSMVMALGFAIVTSVFPANERGRAMGILGSVVSCGVIAGPILGGLLTGLFAWQWVFLVNLPIGAMGIFLVIRYVPDQAPLVRRPFDYVSAFILFLALLPLLSAFTLGQRIGFSSPLFIGMIILFVIFFTVFVLRQNRVENSLVAPRLFENSQFRVGLINQFATFFASSGSMILLTFFLQNILGYEIGKAGIILATIPVVMAIVSPVAGWFCDRFGAWPVIFAGQCTLLTAFAGFATMPHTIGLPDLVVRFGLLGMGIGLFMTPNNKVIMGGASPKDLGLVSGLLTLSRSIGQVVGVGGLGALWAFCIRIRSEGAYAGDLINASVLSRIQAFQDTFTVVVVLIGLSLSYSAYHYIRFHKKLSEN